MIGNRKFRTTAGLVFCGLLVSQAHAQITVTSWNLNEEADALVYPDGGEQGTLEEVDTANYFGPGVVFPYTQTDAVVTPSGLASAAGTYNFFVFDKPGTLGLAFDQYFGRGDGRVALNGGEIDFMATQTLDYQIDGSYWVSSGDDGPGTEVYLLVQLIDATDEEVLFSSNQETETARGTESAYALGDVFGDPDKANDFSGSLQATLISGHNYQFIYQYVISGPPSEDSTEASTSTARGQLNFTVICNLPAITGIVSCIRGSETSDDPGVTLSLLRDGQPVTTGQTGADGTYTFTGLDPGTYTITVTPPPNTQVSGDLSKEVTVECGQDGTASFGVCPCLPASIAGRVLCDSDGQSLPIAGATITAIGGWDNQTGTAISADDGSYTIGGLSPGDYTVSVTPPADAKVCQSASKQVTLDCEQTLTANFCVCPCLGSKITGAVTCSTSGQPTAGVPVTAVDANGAAVGAVVSGSNGGYVIDGLAPGSYTVTMTVPAGFRPCSADSVAVVLACERNGTADFCVCPCNGSVNGRVLCTQDGQSAAMPNVTVTAYLEANAVGSAITTSEGTYTIAGLAPGAYSVKVTLPANTQACGTTTANVTLGCDEEGTADFCVCPIIPTCDPASIAGTVFCAQNGQSTPEPDVTVTAYLNNAVAGSATTDIHGTYAIGGLAVGTYVVVVRPPANSQACGATNVNVTLDCGQTGAADFCVCPCAAAVAGVVTCAQNGQNTPMANVTVTAYQGSTQVATTTSGANGSYTLSGLTPGGYAIKVTPPANDQACSEASVNVTLACGETGAANFCVCPTCPWASIKGRITCTVGSGTAGVSNVTVTAYRNGAVAGSAVSGSDGGYTIGGLAAGTYTVKMTLPSNGLSCGLTSMSVILSCGQTATANFCECPVTGTGCTRTPGYWKTHRSAWPVQSLILGGVTYSPTQLMNLLNTYTPSGQKGASDVSVKVAKFEISAIFSMLSGATPSNIMPVVYSADAFLAAHPPGSNPKGADATLGETIQSQLDNYCNQFDCP